MIPKAEAKERLPISEEQKTLIIKTWREHRMGLPALIMLFCGLRRGELLALTWDDIDIEGAVISITKSVEFLSNRAVLKKPKTKAGERMVPIPLILLSALQSVPHSNTYICYTETDGSMMTECAYKRAWNSYQHYLNIQAGGKDASRSHSKVVAVPPFTAHQLRHTYATMLYDAGVDVKSAQLFLGHSDLSITLKIYTHLSTIKKNMSIDALNTYIDGTIKDVR